MMDHIRQRDWNSSKKLYDTFLDEGDMDNSVIERIIRNKFWDPMISSDEEEPPERINWDGVFLTKNAREGRVHRFVPGFRNLPLHPKLSALTQSQHLSCIKVLSLENRHILPNEFIGKPSNHDTKVYEDIKELYAKEQEEYAEWAKNMWVTTNCIRALRPKPLVEIVYEAEFKMKSQMVQCFPKTYKLAGQIPLKSENYSCDIILPKNDLVKVDISKLPNITYPILNMNKESIINKCPLPQPCLTHPCNFILPNESEVSMLPLTEIHKELAQYALENGAQYVASEGAVRALLETDRTWSLPLSVCEVIGPDGDKTNILVLGSEFQEKKDPAPMRSYRAFRHLLYRAFTSEESRMRSINERKSQRSVSSQSASKLKRSAAKSMPEQRPAEVSKGTKRRLAVHQDSDSDDDDRLQIVLDDDSVKSLEVDGENDNNKTVNKKPTKEPDNQPRKILRSHTRSSCDKNYQARTKEQKMADLFDSSPKSPRATTRSDRKKTNTVGQESSKEADKSAKPIDMGNSPTRPNIQNDLFDIGRFNCVCKDTEFEIPPPRSYKNLLVKNNKTKEQLNVIVHSSHKLKNSVSCEVLLEPILEFQLDIGATESSQSRLQALAFSLLLRKNAELCSVRVDGSCGELVTLESSTLRQLSARHSTFRADTANTLYTTLDQLAGLRPGHYILRHEPEHGANALLYSRHAGRAAPPAVLQAADAALSPAAEARLAHHAPRLRPVFLPIHKYFRQLPLTFTYNTKRIAKESVKPCFKKKTPPAAIEWPKKKGKKGRKAKN